MANLQFPIYQKSLCDDLKKTFLKRASDTDPTRSADDVVTEVSEMLSTDIAVYAEKLFKEISGSGFEGLGEAEDGAILTYDATQKKWVGKVSSGYVTRDEWDTFISGTDADNVINKWSEAERFLSGMRETDNLNTILRYKLDADVFSTLFTALDSSGIPIDLSDKDAISKVATIRANFGFWSVDFVSALGKSTTDGTGGGGVSYERLDSWEDYDESKKEWVLSAGLGYGLYTDIATLVGEIATLKGKSVYWSDIKNTPTTLEGYGIVDAYTKVEVDAMILFEKVNIGTEENPVWAIHAKDGMGVYSDSFISALGLSDTGDIGTTGLYERLDSWDSYSSETAEWVLSAYLGNDLNERINALETLKKGHTIVLTGTGSVVTNVEENENTLTFSKGDLSFSKVIDKPNTLEGYGITDGVNSFEVVGEGNAFTECKIDGHKITFTKGDTFLQKAVFDDLFEKVNIGTQEEPVYAIRAKYGFYSDSFISALGNSTGADIGGGSGVEALYELVDVKANDSLDGVFGAKEGAALIYDGTYWVAGEAGLSETQLNSYLINNGYVTKNDVYTKAEVDSLLVVLNNFFEKVNVGTEDSPRYALHILESMGLYSDDFISALGKSYGGGGSGEAGDFYDRLDAWEDYDDSTKEWVLSALLGYDLHTRIGELDQRLTAVEKKDTYTKEEIDAMILFEKKNIGTEDEPIYAIHAKYGYGVYSDGFISALGVSPDGMGSGGTSYNRLDDWGDYTDDKAEWVLSALLGEDLNERLLAIELGNKGHLIDIVGDGNVVTDVSENSAKTSLTFVKGNVSWATIVEKPTTLEGFGITDGVNDFEITGTGNAFTDVSIKGHIISLNKGETFLPKSAFDELFEKVNIGTSEAPEYAIRAKYGFYSDSFVSAKGYGDSSGGSDYDRLDSWDDYTSTRSGWVLSAYLGNDLNSRISALETLKGGHDIILTGTGGIVTNVSESGNTLTFTKGDLSFAEVIEKPTTIAGYGITDAKIVNGVITLGSDTITPLTAESSLSWGKVTGTPTTLAGYGITDGVNTCSVSGSGNALTGVTISGHTITFAKNETFLPKATFDELFERVNVGTAEEPIYAIRAKYGLYSDSFITAMGYGSSSTDVGVLDRLDKWEDYDGTNGTWVLSAYLGNDLNERVTYLEDNPQGHTIVINGEGSVLTNVSETANKLTFTKGSVKWSDINNIPLGTADGIATLDSSGKVPSSQLPSYVDDVLEYANKASFPSTGESGKIYIDKETNLTYRWGGTTYVEISQSLALGETSSTAYAGDKGKKNAEDIAALQTGKADKATTLSGYGITDAYTKTEVSTKLTDGSVTKIGTKDVGSDTLPIYLNKGVPTACSTTLNVSVTGNAATTTKLENSRTLWGQPFDGSANVSGNMTGVGTITPTGNDLKVVGNLIVTGGIVMYADDGATIESGFAALLAAHIDGVTIKYNKDQGKIYSVMTGIKVNGTTYKPSETDGYITIPDYPTSLDWENIENKPSTFTPASHTHTFASLTNKPTTLSGYGITDAKIANGVITLGTATITPLTAHQTVTLASGTNNGTLKLTVGSTTTDNIAVRGLGSAAYTASSDYAASAHTHSDYVTALGTNGNYLTWTKNGSTSNITVPYATGSSKLMYHSLIGYRTDFDSFTGESAIKVALFQNQGNDDERIVPPFYDGSLISFPWYNDNNYGAQLAVEDSGQTNHLAIRNRNGSNTWGAWAMVLTSANYNLYSPKLDGTGASGTWGINISGNAATATTASKLGTDTVGGGTQHFYLNAGTATASTSTVGGTAKPMYLNAGIMTAISDTVGGTAKPIYLNAGTLTAISATVGSASKPVYLNGGSVTACSYDFNSYLPLAGGTMAADARISYASGNLYLGRADNSGWLYFQDMASQSGTAYWKLTQGGYLTAMGVTVSGNTSVGSLTINGINVTKSSDGILKIEGNLIVTGGITMYATDGVTSGLMEQILVDGTTIGKKADGTLYAINTGNVRSIVMGSTTYSPNSSGIVTLPEKVTWANIEGKPSTFTPSSHTHSDYVTALGTNGNYLTWTKNGSTSNITVSYAGKTDWLISQGVFTTQEEVDAFFDTANRSLKVAYIGNKAFPEFSDGLVLAASVPSSYCHQIHMDDNQPVIHHRSRNVDGSGWYAWSKLLDSSNYSSYAIPVSASCNKNWSWSGQSGQPTWLWGSNDGANCYVWNPSNFSVNYANSAGNADTLDGNHASAFATAGHTHSYLPLSGGTMTGAIITPGNDSIVIKPAKNNYDQIGGEGQVFYKIWATNFYGELHGSCNGNAETASKWATARTLTLTGSVTGSVSIDGSGNVSLATTTNHSHSQYLPLAGGTMTGTLTTVTEGTHEYNQGIRINRTATNQWATLLIGKSGTATSGTGTSTAGDGAWLIATPASSNSLIFNLNSASEAVGLCLKGHGASDMKWNNNTVLHAGNYSSYALPLSGGTMDAGARISHADGNLYLGRSDNNGWVMCQDMCSQTAAGDTYWSLRVDGTFHAKNTTLSGTCDIRNQNAGATSGLVAHKIMCYPSAYYGLVTRIYSTGCVSLQAQRESTNSEVFPLSLNPLGGNVGIGTTETSYKLHVNGRIFTNTGLYVSSDTWSDITIFRGSFGSTVIGVSGGGSGAVFGHTLNGTTKYISVLAGTGLTVDENIIAKGGITMYSDLRKKNILSDEVLSVKEIAAAPLFKHTYKSDDNQYIHVGTSAQYWSGIHEDWFTRKDSEGYYQMELQNLGVAMGISLAREIVKYESKTDKKIRLMKKRINELEKANESLEARVKELEERRTA